MLLPTHLLFLLWLSSSLSLLVFFQVISCPLSFILSHICLSYPSFLSLSNALSSPLLLSSHYSCLPYIQTSLLCHFPNSSFLFRLPFCLLYTFYSVSKALLLLSLSNHSWALIGVTNLWMRLIRELPCVGIIASWSLDILMFLYTLSLLQYSHLTHSSSLPSGLPEWQLLLGMSSGGGVHLLRNVSPCVPSQMCRYGEGTRGGLGVQRVPCGDAGREHGESVSWTLVLGCWLVCWCFVVYEGKRGS